jgi:hypothetical protein
VWRGTETIIVVEVVEKSRKLISIIQVMEVMMDAKNKEEAVCQAYSKGLDYMSKYHG